MSPFCENFIRAVLARQWQTAFVHLNGLNMVEMLRAIAAIDPLDRDDLWAQRAASVSSVNMPRIEYAWSVVQARSLPPVAPGDLAATSQVTDAGNFIARPTPLVFENDLTATLPSPNPDAPRLFETDFIAAAASVGAGAEVSAVMAVAQVEAGGRSGFNTGRPVIRYELHIFHAETGGAYDRSHPHLSQPTLAAGEHFHDYTQPTEWSMLLSAMILREAAGPRRIRAALRSASWGMFQVMGSNYGMGGWSDVVQFASDMFASEGNQLRAFLGYVRASGLGPALINRNWATFAKGYNGPQYAGNHYDTNIGAAYTQIRADRVRRRAPP
jgi:N-acetylmuramidase